MLAAALLHECGHLAAIRLAGAPVLRVDVDVLSACIVYADARVPPRTEVCIALSGPLFNLLGALAGSLLLLSIRQRRRAAVRGRESVPRARQPHPRSQAPMAETRVLHCCCRSFPPDVCTRTCAVVSGAARAVFALLFALSLYATGGNLSLAVLFLLLCMPRGGCV